MRLSKLMVEPAHLVAVPTTVCSSPLSYGHRCSHLVAFMSYGSQKNHVCHLPEVLVARHGAGGPGVHQGLFGLRTQQGVFSGSHGIASTASHPFQTMVGHFHGLGSRSHKETLQYLRWSTDSLRWRNSSPSQSYQPLKKQRR